MCLAPFWLHFDETRTYLKTISLGRVLEGQIGFPRRHPGRSVLATQRLKSLLYASCIYIYIYNWVWGGLLELCYSVMPKTSWWQNPHYVLVLRCFLTEWLAESPDGVHCCSVFTRNRGGFFNCMNCIVSRHKISLSGQIGVGF